MSNIGLGEIISELHKRIQDIKSELDELGDPITEMPELITSANLLRSNEYLAKVSKKQHQLLAAYDQYSEALEGMISVIFDIQNDLKNLLKEQSNLISDRKPVKSARKSPISKKRKFHVSKKRKSPAKIKSSKK